MDHQGSKRLYIRYLSNVVRKWSPNSGVNNMTENPAFPIEGVNRAIIVTICRIRQRLLTQAWSILVQKTQVVHDYEKDVRMILYRQIPTGELRTELEIEVMYNWILQVKDKDPTGIANTIFMCKKKAVIYGALQQLRLEFYDAGETILFQGDIPRPEDGHFTIFKGECEVLQFPDESVPLMKLLYLAKKKRWDDAKALLNTAPIVARIPKLSGFGELSTLTGVKRAATIRTSPRSLEPSEILILPKEALLECLKSRTSEAVDGAATSEAIDFLRQSGLANRISPKDLVSAASSMIRRTLLQGEILYFKGEAAKSIFLVVSGEFLLDTGDFLSSSGQPIPFVDANSDRCFHLSSGSILGEEGVTGERRTYMSTAAVVSSAATVFEAVSFGLTFLAEKVGGLRYSALFYRDKLCWDFAHPVAEQNNPYTFFNSLRKSISHTKPYRAIESLAAAAKADMALQQKQQRLKTANAVISPGTADNKNGKNSKNNDKKGKVGIASPPTIAAAKQASSGSETTNCTSETSTSDAIFQSYSRQLTGVGLHRALDVNRQVKRSLQQLSRLHAKETILSEELYRLPPGSSNGMGAEAEEDAVRALQLFEQSLREYYDRCAAEAKRLREEEEDRKRAAAASRAASAISFFSAGNYNADYDDDTDAHNTAEHSPRNATAEGGAEVDDEMVKKAAEETTKALFGRHRVQRDSVVLEQQMAQLYNKQTDMDLEALHASKLEQYFEWVDNLTFIAHRNLLQQAEQTAEELHDYLHHDPATHNLLHGIKTLDQAYQQQQNPNVMSEEDRWEELNQIFQTYGLTPMDLNPLWKVGNSGSSAAGVGFRTLSVVEEAPKASTRASTAASDPSKDAKRKFAHKRGMSTATNLTVHTASSQHTNITAKRSQATDESGDGAQDRRIKAKIESQFKSYNPSSWRDDMIQKKGVDVVHVFRFDRGATPDNRRVLLHLHTVPAQHTGPHHAYQQQMHQLKQQQEQEKQLQAANAKANTASNSSHNDAASSIDTAALEAEYTRLIDNPAYFIEALQANPLPHIKRSTRDRDVWDTRFLNLQTTRTTHTSLIPTPTSPSSNVASRADNSSPRHQMTNVAANAEEDGKGSAKSSPKVTPKTNGGGKSSKPASKTNSSSKGGPQPASREKLPAVRSHLVEDLSHCSRTALLSRAQRIQEQAETPFMRRIRGQELDNYVVQPASVRSSWAMASSPSKRQRHQQNLLQAALDHAIAAASSPSSSSPHMATTPKFTKAAIGGSGSLEEGSLHTVQTARTVHTVSTTEREYEAAIIQRALQPAVSESLTLPPPHHGSNSIEDVGSETAGGYDSIRGNGEEVEVVMLSTEGGSKDDHDGEDEDDEEDDDAEGEALSSSRRLSEQSQKAAGERPDATSATAAQQQEHVTPTHNSSDVMGQPTQNQATVANTLQQPSAASTDASTTSPNKAATGTTGHPVNLVVQTTGLSSAFSPLPTVMTTTTTRHAKSTRSGANGSSNQPKAYIRYTEVRGASQAIKEFEAFMKSQDGSRQRAQLEGKKKANTKCKYRLAPSLLGDKELNRILGQPTLSSSATATTLDAHETIVEHFPRPSSATTNNDDNANVASGYTTTLGKIISKPPKVSLHHIVAQRQVAELAVFHALYPQATKVQEEAFLRSFEAKYAEREIIADTPLPTSELDKPSPNEHGQIKRTRSTSKTAQNNASGLALSSHILRHSATSLQPLAQLSLAMPGHSHHNGISSPSSRSVTSSHSNGRRSPSQHQHQSPMMLSRGASVHFRPSDLDLGDSVVLNGDLNNSDHAGDHKTGRASRRTSSAVSVASHHSHDSHPPSQPQPTNNSTAAATPLGSPLATAVGRAKQRRRQSAFLLDATKVLLEMSPDDLLQVAQKQDDERRQKQLLRRQKSTLSALGDSYDDNADDKNAIRASFLSDLHNDGTNNGNNRVKFIRDDACKDDQSSYHDNDDLSHQWTDNEHARTEEEGDEEDDADSDEADLRRIEAWQRYTLHTIRTEKDGERKTLPPVSARKTLASLQLTGKRRLPVSNSTVATTTSSAAAELITVPAKASQMPIRGPSSYLSLYKQNFHVSMSRSRREHILAELKEMQLDEH